MSEYERYLRTEELLGLQKTDAERSHRDELLFQTVHQSSELWLKHAGFETETAAQRIRDHDLTGAARLLRRAGLGLRLIIDQIEMLEQISPADYHAIRSVLGQGSGFDSPGFNELQRIAKEVGQAFFGLLADRKISLLELYRNPTANQDAYEIAELLTDWDERLCLWRVHHLMMVERVIGSEAIGTQGTPVALLRELTAHRYFPELWDVRNEMTGSSRRT